MGVTQVIRGDDLVTSTPRQLLLYRALEQPTPRFGHIPLAIGADGRRLAKRDGSIKLATLGAVGSRSPTVDWLARAILRLGRGFNVYLPSRLDRAVQPGDNSIRAVGGHRGRACGVAR